jgi:hypothetical protein
MDSFKGNNDDPQGLHKYEYAEDNPVNRIDPSGRESGAEVGLATTISVQIETSYISTFAKLGLALVADLTLKNQLVMFHVTDAVMVNIANKYNGGSLRTVESTTPMYFASMPWPLGSLFLYGGFFPAAIYLHIFDAITVASIKAFANDLDVPYESLPAELQQPTDVPVTIITASSSSLVASRFFNGGIDVVQDLYLPFINNTFKTVHGETVPENRYKLIDPYKGVK